MRSPARPHISSALQHLRLGVSGTGCVLALALVAQVVIWCCLHFTDMRVRELHGPAASDPSSLQVVVHPTAGGGEGRSLVPGERSGRKKVESGASKLPVQSDGRGSGPDPSSRGVNVVPTRESVILQRSAGIVQTVGVIAAVLLALMMFQGVIVAGGAAVPGVEYAVTASTWTLVIGMVCIPVSSVLPAVPYHGVFSAYGTLARDVDLYRLGAPGGPGALAYFGTNLAVPLLLGLGVIAAVVRFRLGIEQGVIVTNVSQLDERIEKEIRSRKLGELSRPRAVGALNQAIGAAPAGSVMPVPIPPIAPIQANIPAPIIPMEEPQGGSVGSPLRRPI